MEMFKNAVNWFEIPVKNFDKAKAFYESIFDYQMPEMPMGPNRMGILLYDQPGGGIGGAIVAGEWYEPTAGGSLVYLNGGDDLNSVLNRVPNAGGAVVVPKTLIAPEVGYFAIFQDCEGNRVGLHSPK
jgi:predicted enzyme related to lactoylglutathione lyase